MAQYISESPTLPGKKLDCHSSGRIPSHGRVDCSCVAGACAFTWGRDHVPDVAIRKTPSPLRVAFFVGSPQDISALFFYYSQSQGEC